MIISAQTLISKMIGPGWMIYGSWPEPLPGGWYQFFPPFTTNGFSEIAGCGIFYCDPPDPLEPGLEPKLLIEQSNAVFMLEEVSPLWWPSNLQPMDHASEIVLADSTPYSFAVKVIGTFAQGSLWLPGVEYPHPGDPGLNWFALQTSVLTKIGSSP